MREHNEIVNENYWTTHRDEIFKTRQGNMVNVSHFDIFEVRPGIGPSGEYGLVAVKLHGRKPVGPAYLDSEILIWYGDEGECVSCRYFIVDMLGGYSEFTSVEIGE